MIPCCNKERGCSGVFLNRHGLNVHLRSCIFTSSRKLTSRKRNRRSTTALEEYNGRLICDRQTFDIQTISEFEIDYQNRVKELFPFLESTKSTCVAPRDTSSLKIDPGSVNHLMTMLADLARKTGAKYVNNIILTLRHPNFSMDTFRTSCSRVSDCIAYEQNLYASQLEEFGFQRHVVTNQVSNIQCDVYMRDPEQFLRLQVAGASRKSTMFNQRATEEDKDIGYCHPMRAALGKELVPAVENYIRSEKSEKAVWNDSFVKSFVGLVQIYSDKSKTTLKQSAFQFYPVHTTLLNFSEEYRRQCIMKGITIVAFLPVTYYKVVEGDKMQVTLDRKERLEMLHMCMEYVFKGIISLECEGFSCFDMEGTARVCHPCISSYCCDLPEAKDLSSVKNGNSSVRNCHRCLATTSTFNQYSSAEARDAGSCYTLIDEAINLRNSGNSRRAEELLHNQSLIEVKPFLSLFSFLELLPSHNAYSIFNFEPLHNFHLGVSRYLKICLAERLRSTTLTSSSLPTRNGKERTTTFKTIRINVVSGINRMLTHVQRTSPAKGLHVDFSNGTMSDVGNGLYGDDGKLIGMLEGKDYRNIDKISPFIGALADRCCGEETNAPTTEVFTLYVEIMQTSLSYNFYPVNWNENLLQILEEKIKLFKQKATDLYAEFQPSQLRTEKFHQLDHITSDIRKYGGLRCGDASLYEQAHTDVKSAYRCGSKKRRSAMNETMVTYVKQKNCNTDEHGKDYRIQMVPKLLSSKQKSFESDCAWLVQNGNAIYIRDLEKGQKLVRLIRIATDNQNNKDCSQLKQSLSQMDESIVHILNDLGETGCRMLVRELKRSIPRSDGTTFSLPPNAKIIRVISGFVPGIRTPTLRDYDKRWNRISIPIDSERQRQRFVSGSGFYKSGIVRQDSVLIQANGVTKSGKQPLWVGRVLALFRLTSMTVDQKENGDDDEMAFVQFYEVIPAEDRIDSILGCVKMIWARSDDKTSVTNGLSDNIEPSGKWYSLIPVSSIRGVVHVVRADYGVNGRSVYSDMDDVAWDQQKFYINRFYFEDESRMHVS